MWEEVRSELIKGVKSFDYGWEKGHGTAHNTGFTLRSLRSLALRDIAFGNVVNPGNDVRKSLASLAISVHRAPGLTPLDVLRFARSARDFAHLRGWRLRFAPSNLPSRASLRLARPGKFANPGAR